MANWPGPPCARAACCEARVRVVVSAVSALVPVTRAVTNSVGEGAAGSTSALPSAGGQAGARMLSSSRTSMPTGHQVTQRPQPVQPDSPNWSHQVANLWVSHWR